MREEISKETRARLSREDSLVFEEKMRIRVRGSLTRTDVVLVSLREDFQLRIREGSSRPNRESFNRDKDQGIKINKMMLDSRELRLGLIISLELKIRPKSSRDQSKSAEKYVIVKP